MAAVEIRLIKKSDVGLNMPKTSTRPQSPYKKKPAFLIVRHLSTTPASRTGHGFSEENSTYYQVPARSRYSPYARHAPGEPAEPATPPRRRTRLVRNALPETPPNVAGGPKHRGRRKIATPAWAAPLIQGRHRRSPTASAYRHGWYGCGRPEDATVSPSVTHYSAWSTAAAGPSPRPGRSRRRRLQGLPGRV